MIFECPKCKKSGQIDDAKVPDTGVYATCPQCGNRFAIKRETAKDFVFEPINETDSVSAADATLIQTVSHIPEESTSHSPANNAQCRVNDPDIFGSYTGDSLDGYAHGKGIAKGKDVYEGMFKYGNKHGQGVYTWANGDVAEGTYKDGLLNGFSCVKLVNGTFIEGIFEDDQLVNGFYKYNNGDIAEGEFKTKNGQLNGLGIYKFTNGNVAEGTFKDNALNGQGIFKYADGSVAEGTFKDGHLDGQGVMTYKDGTVAEGTFKENILVNGIYKYTNGYVAEGTFKDGHLDG